MSDVDKLQDAEEWASQQEDEKRAVERAQKESELTSEPIKETSKRAKEWRMVPLDKILALPNIRAELSDIHSLAKSIHERGLLTPLIVKPLFEPDEEREGDDLKYELIAGARRKAALELLGETEAMCEIIHELDEAEAYELMFTENVQRQDLPPIQVAKALRYLLELNPDMTARKLAQSLGLESKWVSKHFRLLDLPEEVQKSVDAGDLSFNAADVIRRAIKADRVKEETIVEAVKKMSTGEISAREVRKLAAPPPKTKTAGELELEAEETRKKEESTVYQARDAEGGPPSRDAKDAALRKIMSEMPSPRLSEGAIDVEPELITTWNQDAPEAAGEYDQRHGAQQVWSDVERPLDRSELETRVDKYLLARALSEWAHEDYLDSQDIPKDAIKDYVDSVENPLEQLRHLVFWLIQSE